jgi:hypothetical protein
MDEKRKFKRFETKEATFLNKEEGKPQEGSILDISPGGMRIVLDQETPLGSAISGQFKILPNLGPFYVKGEVAWVKPAKMTESQNSFLIGIKFNKVSALPF